MEFKEFDFGGGKCLNSCTLRGHQNVHENASLEETLWISKFCYQNVLTF